MFSEVFQCLFNLVYSMFEKWLCLKCNSGYKSFVLQSFFMVSLAAKCHYRGVSLLCSTLPEDCPKIENV